MDRQLKLLCRLKARVGECCVVVTVMTHRIGFGIGQSMSDADIVMGYAVGDNAVVGRVVS